MRIGIDARFYSEQGHGRYIRNLIEQLAKIDSEDEYVIFLTKKDFPKFQIPNSRFQKVLADVRWYTLREQILLLKIYNKANLDLLHVPHFNVPVFYKGPFIVTIHDLTITHFPSIRSTTLPLYLWKIKRLGYSFVLKKALQRAKHIIAVSNFTKQDILHDFPSIPENKITVIHEAVEESFIQKAQTSKSPVILRYSEETSGDAARTSKRDGTETPRDPSPASKPDQNDEITDNIRRKYGVTKQYLLYIGNVHPHKNIERLTRVFHKLQADLSGNVQLVLVGKDDYFQNRLKLETRNLQLETNLIWTGFVPDEDLIPLLKGAACFVFPSLTEGFGIPPLEAMAAGTPTAVSNAGSLPEVCGDASAYFSPTDDNEMYAVLKQVLQDENLRATLIQKGHDQIKKYSWEKMAKETLTAYKTV